MTDTATAKRSLRDTILAASDIRLREIELPEWAPDGGVFIRKLSHEQGMRVIADVSGDDPDVNAVTLTLLIMGLCDSDGTPLFGEEDRTLLGQKSNAVIKRVFTEIQNFNGIGADAEEDIAGN